jgi:hypothetical protein
MSPGLLPKPHFSAWAGTNAGPKDNYTMNVAAKLPQERGRLRQVSALEAMVKRLINEALKGNIKAIEFLLAKEPEITRKAEPMERITPDMDANEAANVYLRMVRRVR